MSSVSSAESSAHHPVNYPDNSQVLFGQRLSNGRIPSEPMLANVRHDVRGRIRSMTSPQSIHNRDRSRFASAQRPANHTGNGRATSAQRPNSCRETSHATAANVRTGLAQQPGCIRAIAAEVCEAVRLADAQCLVWRPVDRPHSIRRIVHAISKAVFVKWLEHGPQRPANRP